MRLRAARALFWVLLLVVPIGQGGAITRAPEAHAWIDPSLPHAAGGEQEPLPWPGRAAPAAAAAAPEVEQAGSVAAAVEQPFSVEKQWLALPGKAAQEVETRAERQAADAAIALQSLVPGNAAAAEAPGKAEVQPAQRRLQQVERELHRTEQPEAEREARTGDGAAAAAKWAVERHRQAASTKGSRGSAESDLAQADTLWSSRQAAGDRSSSSSRGTAGVAGTSRRLLVETMAVARQGLAGGVAEAPTGQQPVAAEEDQAEEGEVGGGVERPPVGTGPVSRALLMQQRDPGLTSRLVCSGKRLCDMLTLLAAHRRCQPALGGGASPLPGSSTTPPPAIIQNTITSAADALPGTDSPAAPALPAIDDAGEAAEQQVVPGAANPPPADEDTSSPLLAPTERPQPSTGPPTDNQQQELPVVGPPAPGITPQPPAPTGGLLVPYCVCQQLCADVIAGAYGRHTNTFCAADLDPRQPNRWFILVQGRGRAVCYNPAPEIQAQKPPGQPPKRP